MKEIEQIYFNDFGVAFHWKKNDMVLSEKVQLVFKETGFYFSYSEMKDFAYLITVACRETGCDAFCHKSQCRKYLLKTPLQQIDLAMTKNELLQIRDLVEGTIFNMELHEYLNNEGRN